AGKKAIKEADRTQVSPNKTDWIIAVTLVAPLLESGNLFNFRFQGRKQIKFSMGDTSPVIKIHSFAATAAACDLWKEKLQVKIGGIN
ncbi:hypothetical protein CEXT_616121, partial [Caerostris extrusa]